ncbi:hypothetical protein ACSBL2_18805 [Pedobacter sp. AW31-3R]|uniref:hypothetical protein n=1 Tax=Pedobacter sp. AW31-3R TaxID=3445781 RepID=UPI003FA0B5B6
MKTYLFFILFCAISSHLFAQSDDPVIPVSGTAIKSFIPKGWKMISNSKGDLNKDGIADEAIVIQNTSLKNIRTKEEGRMGDDTLNFNPRMLIVVFKNAKGKYDLAVKNIAFIPMQNDTVSACLLDPLLESEGVTIDKGLLKINYKYFYSCGGWEVTTDTYSFRYQNQKFELIGYDYYSMHRSSGEESSASINFSTLKKKSTSGGNVFSEETNKPKTVWSKIKPVKLLSLATLTDDILTDYLAKMAM